MPDEKGLVVDGWLYYGAGGFIRVEDVSGIQRVVPHHETYKSYVYFKSGGSGLSTYPVNELARALGLDLTLIGLDEEVPTDV